MLQRDSIKWLSRLDWLYVLAILALAAIGIVFIYSASYRNEEEWMTALTRKQIVWFAAGIVFFIGTVLVDYRTIAKNAWLIYLGCLILLVMVLFMGVKIYGSYRWLNLFGIQLQPSEFAKLGTLLILARYLSVPSRDMSDFKTLYAVMFLLALPFMLISQQPDLGASVMLLPIAFVLLYAGGVPARYLFTIIGIGLVLLPFSWFVLDGYQKERILVFFDSSRDPLGTGWSKIQSQIAVGSGGIGGKGLLMGTQNILGYLPKNVAPTDFIFSVIAEERGFVGAVLVLSLYAVLMIRGIAAAIVSRDKLGRLIAAGFTTMMFCHMFVNIAMTIGLAPIKGLPLPLISYGGSFMVCTMIGLGLVQSVYVRRMDR